MKTVKVVKWTEKITNPETGKSKDIESDTMGLISNLLRIRVDAKKLPPGTDSFRLMVRVSQASNRAEKNGKIQLEEGDYAILKRAIDEDIPPGWGLMPDVVKAIDQILAADKKEES